MSTDITQGIDTALMSHNEPGFNKALVVLKSAAYTTDQSLKIKNIQSKGCQIILDVTAKTSTPTSITLTLSGVDPASGKKYTIIAGAAVTGVSTNVYRVSMAATPTTNVTVNDEIPADLVIDIVGVGVTASAYFTYSVGMNFF